MEFKPTKFDSKDQERGYLAFLHWAKERGYPNDVRPIDLFFIQKDHESNEYWREVVSQNVRQLQDEIVKLRSTVEGLQQQLASMTRATDTPVGFF